MQYRTGSVTVVNGSAELVFADAVVGAENVAIGDLFKTDRDGDAVYQIASRTPSSGAALTAATLSAPYGGADAAGLAFQIVSDFTVNREYPRPNQGDADAADWIAAALDAIDADIAAFLGVSLPSTLALAGVIYKGEAGLATDAELSWDNVNKRLCIGTATSVRRVTIHAGATVDGVLVQASGVGRALLELYDGTATTSLSSSLGIPQLTTDGTLFYFQDSDIIRLRLDSGRLVVGLGTVTADAALAGELVLGNAKRLRGVNAANTTTKPLIGFDSSDRVELAAGGEIIKIGTPIVALGTGAIATPGPVGGSGPISSAQSGWLSFVDSTGLTRFIGVFT